MMQIVQKGGFGLRVLRQGEEDCFGIGLRRFCCTYSPQPVVCWCTLLLPPYHIMNGMLHVANTVYPPFVEVATADATLPQISASTNPSTLPAPNNPPDPQNPASINPPASTNPPTLPAPNNPPNPSRRNSWNFVNEMGDGACGFCAISRRIHHDPNKHVQLRQEISRYMNENRNDPDFQHAITQGINREHLHILGEYPQKYTSYDTLQIMSHTHERT